MVDVKGKNVFLSGPMTDMPHFNVDAFSIAHDMLKKMDVGYVCNPAIRYLTMGASKLKEMKRHDFMLDSIHELTEREAHGRSYTWVKPYKYDMLVLLDGWQDSRGARLEREVALDCGIPVYELAEVVGENG